MKITHWKPLFLTVLFQPLVTFGVTPLSNATRTEASIQFEYILEVRDLNDSGAAPVVHQIDSTILGELQKKLSSVEGLDKDGVPTIILTDVQSTIYSHCSPMAEHTECANVGTILLVSYAVGTSKEFIEFEILQLAKAFLADFDSRFSNVRSIYMFPRIEESIGQLTIAGMDQTMNPSVIAVFERTIVQVFGETLGSVGGDTNILDAKYVYQEQNDRQLMTQVMISGVCQQCTSEEFANIVSVVVDSTLDRFQKQLKENANAIGSDAFDSITSIEYTTPDEPHFLDSSDEDASSEGMGSSSHPWFIWFGMSLAIAMLVLGAYILRKQLLEAKYSSKNKIEYSGDTSDSSDDGDGMEDVELDDRNAVERYRADSLDATSNPWFV
eukprot:scaffold4805_cov136-Cylindrotheca_fusiformis.AAC.14